MDFSSTRRRFISNGLAGFSAAWLSANWPAVLAAAEHARKLRAGLTFGAKLDFFAPEEAIEVDAITARIIPSDETAGAREAGVVYFIDRALATFAIDDQKAFRDGLPKLHEHVHEAFPDAANFSSLTPEQQDAVLHSFDEQATTVRRAFRPSPVAQNFVEIVRSYSISGFLIDPEGGGNRNFVGWKVIGRDPAHMFQSPFGYYDKDYPGWQPQSSEPEKNS